MSASARARLRFIGSTAAIIVMLSFGATGAVATFSARAEVPAAISTATLLPVTSAQATVDADGIERVSWDAPPTDGGADMMYKLKRSIDGAPTTVVTDSLFARSFTVELSVPATFESLLITDISLGERSSCAIADGDIYCWGSSPAGTFTSPTAIFKPAGAEHLDFITVSVGYYQDCAIMEARFPCAVTAW